jgi:kynurenine 3-monooxygenase
MSNRGWKALDAVGVGDEIRKIAIPMEEQFT